MTTKTPREVIAEQFRRAHRDCCYPDCAPFEALATGDAILSALTAAGYTVEQGWQPIATAPRDSGSVLLSGRWNERASPHCRGKRYVTVGSWSTLRADGTGKTWFYETSFLGPMSLEAVDFDHWRPLPAPPAEKAADYGAPCTEQDHRCMHVDETNLRNFKPCESCPYAERFALRRAEIAKAAG